MVNSAAYSSRYDDDPGVGLGVGPGIGETVLKWISTTHFLNKLFIYLKSLPHKTVRQL